MLWVGLQREHAPAGRGWKCHRAFARDDGYCYWKSPPFPRRKERRDTKVSGRTMFAQYSRCGYGVITNPVGSCNAVGIVLVGPTNPLL